MENPPGARRILHEHIVRYSADEIGVYREIQSVKSARQSDAVWFSETNLKAIGAMVNDLAPSPSFGICHGAKHGRECQALARATGATVVGTDISDHVRGLPGMVVWDFHEPNPQWGGKADFIYSNAWDHAHDPSRAFTSWADALRPGGILALEHSPLHLPEATTPADCYGATRDALRARVLSTGLFEFSAERQLPDTAREDWVILFTRRP